MEKTRANKKNLIIIIAVLLVIVAAMALLYVMNAPTGTQGMKSIVVHVVHGDGSQKEIPIKTDAEYLRGALEENKLVSGTEGQMGLMVDTVDGETADAAKEQWWCVSKAGEALMQGVDTTAIADGEAYEFTLTTGW